MNDKIQINCPDSGHSLTIRGQQIATAMTVLSDRFCATDGRLQIYLLAGFAAREP